MRLNDFYNPTDEELEQTFQWLYHTIRPFSWFEKLLVAILYKKMGDRLLVLIAQRLHGHTIQTLHHVEVGMHKDWFKRRRREKQLIKALAKNFVQSVDVD